MKTRTRPRFVGTPPRGMGEAMLAFAFFLVVVVI